MIRRAIGQIAAFAARWYLLWIAYVVLLLPVVAALAIGESLLSATWQALCAFRGRLADAHSGFPSFCRDVAYVLSIDGWRERRVSLREAERAHADAS